MSNHWKSRLLRNSAWLSLGLLVGRLLGFGRDWLIASSFGATTQADIAVVLLTFPDLLINVLAGGALSYTLIPEFTRQAAQRRDGALFVQASLLVFAAFSLVALLCVLYSETLVRLIVPGFSADAMDDTAGLLSVALWVIPLTVLAGVSTAFLQSKERFAIPALGTFIFNLVLVAGLIVGYGSAKTIQWLPALILAGAGLRWLSQLYSARPLLADRAWRGDLVLNRQLGSSYLHLLASAGVLMMLPLIARAYASLLEPGSVTIINLALRLVEFPLAVAVTVFAAGMFPALSHAFASPEGEPEMIVKVTMERVLYTSLLIAIPLCWFGTGVAQVLFSWGNMSPDQAQLIGQLFAIAIISLPLQGGVQVLLTVINAKQEPHLMMPISLAALGFFGMVAWLLMGRYGLYGLVVSLLSTYLLVILLQGRTIMRRYEIPVFAIMLEVILCRAFVGLFVGANVAALLLLLVATTPLLKMAAAGLLGVATLLLAYRQCPHLFSNR